MKHQNMQIQRSYSGFSQLNCRVGLLPLMCFLLKRISGICFDLEVKSLIYTFDHGVT